MTCSGVRQRPTVRDAQPGIIDAALHRSRPVAPVGTGLRSLPATTSVPTARSTRASAERRSSPSGTAGIGLDVGPGVRPHSGADLSTGTVDCGTLICPWHGLRSAGDWEFGWRTLPAHDDGVLAWLRLDTVRRRRTAGPSGCSGPAHRQRLHAVTRLVGVCEPDDIIANRLDSWHGAGFHPYSFTHLDVLTAPPVDDGLAEDADRFLVGRDIPDRPAQDPGGGRIHQP